MLSQNWETTQLRFHNQERKCWQASASAKAQWRNRKLLYSFDLTRVRDIQGATDRQRTNGQMLLRRDF